MGVYGVIVDSYDLRLCKKNCKQHSASNRVDTA